MAILSCHFIPWLFQVFIFKQLKRNARKWEMKRFVAQCFITVFLAEEILMAIWMPCPALLWAPLEPLFGLTTSAHIGWFWFGFRRYRRDSSVSFYEYIFFSSQVPLERLYKTIIFPCDTKIDPLECITMAHWSVLIRFPFKRGWSILMQSKWFCF